MKEVAALSGQSLDVLFSVDEGEAKTLTGHVTGAEVSVRRCCMKCCAWQVEFDGKCKFHRCERCGLLQRIASFQPTVTAKVSLSGDFGEEDFKVSNSVLKHHLEKEGLIELLSDRQNIEEHLFEIGLCSFKMQNNTVIALSKVEQAVKPVAEAVNLLGEAEAIEMESWFDEGDHLLDEPVPTGIGHGSCKMADTAACNPGARALKRSRLKPEIYRTIDGKVIVEDELLNFLAVKIKTLSQDEIVLLATNTFDSEAIEASKKVLFELCPGTSQRCVAYKGQHRDANNIKLCLKVLNECGSNIPRFVSYYLDDLPPVTFSSLDVSCLLRRMEQLCAEVGALKHITQLQTGVCEQVRAEAVEFNHRVSVLECRSGNPTASAVAAAGGISPGSKKALHHGPGNAMEPTQPGVRGGEHALAVEQGVGGLADLHTMGDTFARCPEPVQCSRDGTVAVDAATGKDPVGTADGHAAIENMGIKYGVTITDHIPLALTINIEELPSTASNNNAISGNNPSGSVLYELQLSYGLFGKASEESITIIHPAGDESMHKFL
ncbi:hypothetical protein PO909_029348 [Leuciscus waleckii]